MASKVFSRITRYCPGVARAFVLGPSAQRQEQLYRLSNGFYSVAGPHCSSLNKCVPCQIKPQKYTFGNSTFQRFSSSSSSSSSQPTEEDHPSTAEENNADQANVSEKADEGGAETEAKNGNLNSSIKQRRRIRNKRIAFSDSEEEDTDLSIDDLIKLVDEKEELLKLKHKEIEKMQDKVLRSYADMENVLDRTKREAESSKKFAIQNFAKSLLDVADNLGRASSVVKESFSKIDATKDFSGAVPLLRTLLEGVDMTEKQLVEVFKKYGIQKFDPMNEHFDPHRHHALFQIPDASKPPGTVATVVKVGYMLHDRIIRPAEVGVTEALNGDADKSSED